MCPHLLERERFLNSCELYLLPGRCPPNYNHIDLHNKVYGYWKSFWLETFANNKSNSQPSADVFYRQDTVAVLTYELDIIGTLFCSENNVASDVVSEIKYFNRPHIHEFCSRNKNSGLSNIATYEMLTVNPKYRRRITGVPFGSILLGLIAECFKSMQADMMIGPVRLDNGVDKMVSDFGWELVSESYMMHETPVSLSVLFKSGVRPTEDQFIQKHISRLWNERRDLRAYRTEEKVLNEVGALL